MLPVKGGLQVQRQQKSILDVESTNSDSLQIRNRLDHTVGSSRGNMIVSAPSLSQEVPAVALTTTTNIPSATTTSTTTTKVSRLTQKLSKYHRRSTAQDFPADEITEGASTTIVEEEGKDDHPNLPRKLLPPLPMLTNTSQVTTNGSTGRGTSPESNGSTSSIDQPIRKCHGRSSNNNSNTHQNNTSSILSSSSLYHSLDDDDDDNAIDDATVTNNRSIHSNQGLISVSSAKKLMVGLDEGRCYDENDFAELDEERETRTNTDPHDDNAYTFDPTNRINYNNTYSDNDDHDSDHLATVMTPIYDDSLLSFHTALQQQPRPIVSSLNISSNNTSTGNNRSLIQMKQNTTKSPLSSPTSNRSLLTYDETGVRTRNSTIDSYTLASSSLSILQQPTPSKQQRLLLEQQQQLQQPLEPPQMKRYNHYDWSFSEDTPSNQKNDRIPPGREGQIRCHNNNKTSFDYEDNSTLATVTISNTSQQNITMSSTSDTSFEGPSFETYPEQHQEQRQSKAKASDNDKKGSLLLNARNFTHQQLHQSRSKMVSPQPITHNNNNSNNIERDTLVIVEGKGETLEFRHSSLILQYASNELAKHFIECNLGEDDTVNAKRDGTIQYMLHIQIPDTAGCCAQDWNIIQPFLEPHAVQPAIVTPSNLSILLPWFQRLNLRVLMQECDMQLMYHLVSPPTKLQQQQVSSSVTDYNVTVFNTILLAQIAVQAGLDRTSKQAFIIASTWLTKFPNIWLLEKQQKRQSDDDGTNESITLIVQALNLLVQCLQIGDGASINSDYDESCEMDTSFESVNTSSWEFMFHPSEAACLFSSMISYLPSDCVRQQQLHYRRNIYLLLTNPICPYLIREGIQKHQRQLRMETAVIDQVVDNDGPLQQQFIPEVQHAIPYNESVEMIAENDTVVVDNVSSSVKFQQEARDIESQDSGSNNITLGNPSFTQVAEEIHTSWTTLWMKIAGTSIVPGIIDADQNESIDESTIQKQEQLQKNNQNSTMYQQLILNRTFSDQHSEMLLLQDPQELSDWLQVVWEKLCHPPIFMDATPAASANTLHNNKNRRRGIHWSKTQEIVNTGSLTTTTSTDRNAITSSSKDNKTMATIPIVSAIRSNTKKSKSTSIGNRKTTFNPTRNSSNMNEQPPLVEDRLSTTTLQRRTFAC